LLRIWEARGMWCRPRRPVPAAADEVGRSLCAWAPPPPPVAVSAATRRARAHRQDMLRSLPRSGEGR